MPKYIFTLILLFLAFAPSPTRAQLVVPDDLGLSIDLDATSSCQDPDSTKILKKLDLDWISLAKSRRLDINDTTVRYPKFIDFCVRVYRWAEKTFNTYDPEYVAGTGKHGKVRLVSDNWTDSYMFRSEQSDPLIMVSNLYANIGVQANYSILSASYSVDMNSVLTDRVSKHRKLGFSFSCAKIYGEAYYWKNNGSTVIRQFGDTSDKKGRKLKHVPFDGLDFKAFGALAFYIFNSRKFSYAAAYNLSNYQLKSAGSWLLGMTGTFYDCNFDFTKLPEEVKKVTEIPYDTYALDYNSINIMGGYSYNWVINKHFLFNTTTLPAIGMSFSFSDSTAGRRDLFSMAIQQMMSLTYINRQFFIAATSSFHGNYFLTKSVGFMSGIENFQISTGVRF